MSRDRFLQIRRGLWGLATLRRCSVAEWVELGLAAGTVARGGNGLLRAHAWLERDGTVLLGGAASPCLYRPLSG